MAGGAQATEGDVAEGVSRPGADTGSLPAEEKPARAEGSGKRSFQRLLMTCGEAAQQSFRRSDGRSRRQMFPTYVEN